MKSQWLAVQSFQHSQELLDAINTLSIHIQLQIAGMPDEDRDEEVAESRAKLAAFLTDLQPILAEQEKGERKPVLGTNPRMRQLARSFISAKRNRRQFRSALFHDTLADAQRLLFSDSEEDRRGLLQILNDLRVLLEEHVHADTAELLGEF